MKEKLLTPAEAGEYLGGIQTNTLANWRWRGGGHSTGRLGGALAMRSPTSTSSLRTVSAGLLRTFSGLGDDDRGKKSPGGFKLPGFFYAGILLSSHCHWALYSGHPVTLP